MLIKKITDYLNPNQDYEIIFCINLNFTILALPDALLIPSWLVELLPFTPQLFTHNIKKYLKLFIGKHSKYFKSKKSKRLIPM